jgi:cytidine deaminase
VTDVDLDALLDRARRAQTAAYAPYSGFRVGAALLVGDGRVFLGANVENAAYSPSICAERVAVPSAVVAGARDLVALAVVGDGPGPCTPCGVCRQVLFEFAPDLPIIAAGASGAPARYVLGRDLLPAGFGPVRLAAGDGPGGPPG